jgi:hypothetical protein
MEEGSTFALEVGLRKLVAGFARRSLSVLWFVSDVDVNLYPADLFVFYIVIGKYLPTKRSREIIQPRSGHLNDAKAQRDA